ncbi:MAG: septal ring lytic transglycosylase RlpA family protein [Candidatus Obscuribacterales bacterium]
MASGITSLLCAASILLTLAPAAGAASAKRFSGNVSWYGPGLQGNKTASGERFNMHALTAAHRSLPFGTKVMVENPKNGKSVIVKVNDRGPFVKSRVMDLSQGAAKQLGTLLGGVAFVECTILPDDD